MKRWLAVLSISAALVAWHGHAQAACTYSTIFVGSKMIICTTCCNAGQCVTQCD